MAGGTGEKIQLCFIQLFSRQTNLKERSHPSAANLTGAKCFLKKLLQWKTDQAQPS